MTRRTRQRIEDLERRLALLESGTLTLRLNEQVVESLHRTLTTAKETNQRWTDIYIPVDASRVVRQP